MGRPFEERKRRHLALVFALQTAALCANNLVAGVTTDDSWPRWGGPVGGFRSTTTVASEWPKKGPKVRWRADAVGGHSAPVVEGDRVYVVSGHGRSHRVTALERTTGNAIWTHETTTRFASHRTDWDGPHATPALVGDLLIVVQIDGIVRAHDRGTGAVRWQRDLVADHRVTLPQSGWAASPLPQGDTVLLPGLGGAAPGAIALRVSDGSTAWTSGSFRSSHASPILIEPAGAPLAVFHGMEELVAIDPDDGAVLWTRPLRSGAMDNVSFTPLWDAERRLLVISHRYDDVGTQAFRFPEGSGIPTQSPVWTQRRLQVEHGNGVLLGDTLVASHRGTPGLLVGVDLLTGAVGWRARLPKATLIAAGSPTPNAADGDVANGRLLVLDESGRLHLATATAETFDRLSSFQVFEEQSWTVPTLAGRDLVLRNGSEVVLYELP